MAVLGVLLAFASAKVGGERTDLVKTMVEQNDAHMRYVTQDIKHRAAVVALRQLRATLPALVGAGSKSGGRGADMVDRQEIVRMAQTVARYYGESQVAREWADAYTPAVQAHVEGQERYELAMLCAEIGIVLASVSLLLRRRIGWYVSLGLGAAAVVIMILTYARTLPAVQATEERTAEAARNYRKLRAANKTTAEDEALVREILATYGGQ